MDETRVLIVADDPLARAGLATLLADAAGIAVVGQIGSQDGLDEALAVYRPDVIAWDAGWDTGAALERVAELGDGAPPVVTLISDASPGLEAWQAGARGILDRAAGLERLASALQAVARGAVVVDPDVARGLLPSRERAPAPPVEDLTPREVEVLGLLAEGLPNKTIAERLGISDHTVKFHVNAILGKLGAESRTEAVIRATRLGLILL